MELLKEWTACICITLVVAVIFSLLTPKGRMGSFYRIMVSLFVFLSFIYPLRNCDFKSVKFDSAFSMADVQESNNRLVEGMLETQIKSVLEQNNIDFSSVSANVRQRDSDIEVLSISVAVCDGYDESSVKQILFENLGINAEVHGVGD